jgi:hypothetical protein
LQSPRIYHLSSAGSALCLDAPNDLIGAFPLVLIPTFLVPISIVLHLASLTKLRRAATRRIRAGAIAIHAA